MELVQHVYSVLAISTREKFYTSLRGLLPEERYSPLCWESDVTSARRLLLERTFDIVVISTPLPDEFGHELCADAVEKTDAGVIFLAKAAAAEQLLTPLSEEGVLLVTKPFSNTFFLQAIQMAAASNHRLLLLRQENQRMQEKLSLIHISEPTRP